MPLLLKDIAIKAGVSEATVSRALNGTGRMALTTRARICALAKELGYQGNILARGLASGKTNLVGVCGGPLLEPFMEKFTRALATELANQGLTMLLTPLQARKGLLTLANLKVAALVSCWEDIPKAQAPNLPLVVVGQKSRSFPSFDVDRQAGVAAGINYLIRLGHRHIIYLGGPNEQAKLSGYSAAMAKAGLSTEELILPCGSSSLDGYKAAALLLARSPRPTAVFTTNDEIARGLLEAFKEAQILVPEAMSVLGYDGTFLDDSGRAPFATLAQPAQELAVAVAAFLKSALTTPTHYQKTSIALAPKLVLGGSIGPAPQN